MKVPSVGANLNGVLKYLFIVSVIIVSLDILLIARRQKIAGC